MKIAEEVNGMKKRAMSLALSVMFLTTSIVYGNEEIKYYNLNDLTRLVLEDNAEINSIDANAQQAKIQYEMMEEDYEELKENIEKVRKNLETRRKLTEQAKEEYEMAGGSFLERDRTYINYKTNLEIEKNVEQQYQRMVKEQAQSMKQMENMVFTGKNSKVIQEQESEKLKLQVQKDYYNLVVLDEQIKLTEGRLEGQDVTIRVEAAKARLNMATSVSVESLKSQRRALELSISEMEANRKTLVDSLINTVGLDATEDFDILLEVPTTLNLQKFELDTLMNSFKEKNSDLVTLKKNVTIQQEVITNMELGFKEDDNDYKLSLLQLETDLLNLNKYEQTVDQYIKNLYYQYERSKETVYQQIENKKVLDEQLRQMEVQHELGLISDMQMSSYRQDYHQSVFDYQKAFIDLANTRKEVDLVLKGAMATSSR